MKLFKIKPTKTVCLHYFKLTFRFLLFITALFLYIYNRSNPSGEYFGGFEQNDAFLAVIWVIFALEMVLRFFPSKLESMGCQKQFQKNYIAKPNNEKRISVHPWIVTFAVASAWFALNATIGVLYFMGVINRGILLLVCLFYSVCDVICILFFCPFQVWFMKNKCCVTCRIYNWDYAMMFTPLIYIPNIYAWTLLGLALLLLLKWEINYRVHPERFSEKTNCSLSCTNCTEKLCNQKHQLIEFRKKIKK